MSPVLVSEKKLSARERRQEERLENILRSSQEVLEQCRVKRAELEKTCAAHLRLLVSDKEDERAARSSKKSPKKLQNHHLDDKYVCRATILEMMKQEVELEHQLEKKLDETIDEQKKANILSKIEHQTEQYSSRLMKMMDVYDPKVHVDQRRRSPTRVLKPLDAQFCEGRIPRDKSKKSQKRSRKKQETYADKLSMSPHLHRTSPVRGAKVSKAQQHGLDFDTLRSKLEEHEKDLYKPVAQMVQDRAATFNSSTASTKPFSFVISDNTVSSSLVRTLQRKHPPRSERSHRTLELLLDEKQFEEHTKRWEQALGGPKEKERDAVEAKVSSKKETPQSPYIRRSKTHEKKHATCDTDTDQSAQDKLRVTEEEKEEEDTHQKLHEQKDYVQHKMDRVTCDDPTAAKQECHSAMKVTVEDAVEKDVIEELGSPAARSNGDWMSSKSSNKAHGEKEIGGDHSSMHEGNNTAHTETEKNAHPMKENKGDTRTGRESVWQESIQLEVDTNTAGHECREKTADVEDAVVGDDEKIKQRMQVALESQLKIGERNQFKHKVEQAQADIERMRASNAAHGAECWVEVYDPSHHAFYYYSSTSATSTWEKPYEYVMAADDEMMNAVIKIQCLFRVRRAQAEKVQRRASLQQRLLV